MRSFTARNPFYNPLCKNTRAAEALARNIQRLENHFHNYLLWKARVANKWNVALDMMLHQKKLIRDCWEDIKGCETEAVELDIAFLKG